MTGMKRAGRIGRLVVALGISAAGATAQDAQQALSLTYLCAGGAVLQVAYLNPPAEAGWAVVSYAGLLVPMQAGPTGSGVRYRATDGGGLVWHTKGDAGFLARDLGDHQETLLDDCLRTGS
jgi:membrane-bound inhibitor of C-type lysozyme